MDKRQNSVHKEVSCVSVFDMSLTSPQSLSLAVCNRKAEW